MSVPKSPVLTCSRGFLAQADVKVSSPESASRASASPASNQSQNVNVVVYPQINDTGQTQSEAPMGLEHQRCDGLAHYDSQNPYETVHPEVVVKNVDNPAPTQDIVKTRSVETAESTMTSLQKLITDKDAMIEALNLLLDIYEHNPLIVNKYVIAESNVLSQLIHSLTLSEQVTIKTQDYEPGCLAKKKSQISYIDKILIQNGDDIYNVKYNCPDVIEFLELHHISTKFCYSST